MSNEEIRNKYPEINEQIELYNKDLLHPKEFNIPWNNNNAEHSIKPFAKWRKRNTVNLTTSNIQSHLVLLSMLQTCKYRGINFFEFLKAGEKSIFEFSKKYK